ncbi:uncharacterized protein V6R79_024966 [Siganus canaliculatus]
MTTLETRPFARMPHYKGPGVEAGDRLGHLTIRKSLRKVHSKGQSKLWDFLGGHCVMEIAVLLLLTVTLTTATPLRQTRRSEAEVVLTGDTAPAPGETKSDITQHVKALRIVPFHSDNKHLDLNALKHSMAVKLRARRAPQGGCKFATCQLHNLANTLNQFSDKNGKDQSKNTRDPKGYGR